MVLLIALLGVVATAAMVWSSDHDKVRLHSDVVADQDRRIRKLEDSQQEMAMMRRQLEEMREDVRYLVRRAQRTTP